MYREYSMPALNSITPTLQACFGAWVHCVWKTFYLVEEIVLCVCGREWEEAVLV